MKAVKKTKHTVFVLQGFTEISCWKMTPSSSNDVLVISLVIGSCVPQQNNAIKRIQWCLIILWGKNIKLLSSVLKYLISNGIASCSASFCLNLTIHLKRKIYCFGSPRSWGLLVNDVFTTLCKGGAFTAPSDDDDNDCHSRCWEPSSSV